MKFSRKGIASIGLGLAMAAGSFAWAAEKDDAALAKAPAAVQATVKKALGTRKMEEFGRELVGVRTVYEIGFKVDGVDHALIVSEGGELLEEEADVDVAKLPAAVTATIKKAQPDGKISEAATASTGDKKYYEIDVKVGKDVHAIKVKEDGTFIADEVTITLPAEGAAK